MWSNIALAALSGAALVTAQNPPAATPSNAVLISGDASYDGPVIPGTTGKLGNAALVNDNPVGAVYQAVLPATKQYGRGYVKAVTGAGGKGIQFSVSFSGLPPATAGPFRMSFEIAKRVVR